MAVTTENIVSPLGEIEHESMFPDDDDEEFDARISGYITDGYTRTSIDSAVTAWAHYRALNAVYLRLSAEPGRGDLDEGGSFSYLLTQMHNFRDRAQEFKAQFDATIKASIVVGPVYIPGTTAVGTDISL